MQDFIESTDPGISGARATCPRRRERTAQRGCQSNTRSWCCLDNLTD